jgi:Chlorophyll A-B binding protein
MKTGIIASLVASAAAFTSQQAARPATSLAAVAKKPVKKAPAKKAPAKSFSSELGVQPPLDFWDPLGLLDGADQERFDRLRYVEIKHGRIAMLAVVGFLTTEWAGARLPGAIDYSGTAFADIPGGFGAITTMPPLGLAQILLFVGWLELSGWKQDPSSFPGDFSASSFPVGFISSAKTADDQEKLRAQELNQGRAAQMGILALMVHEQLGVNILPPAP